MNNKNFSISEAIKFSFRAILNNFALVFSINVIYFLFLIIPIAVSAILLSLSFKSIMFTTDPFSIMRLLASSLTSIIISISGFILLMLALSVYNIGVIHVALKLYSGENVKFNDLFERYDLAPRVIFANILYFLIVATGLALFVLPGIFFAVRLFFYQTYIIDRNLSITDSFKESYALTQSVWWKVFFSLLLFNFISGTITKIPFLTLFFGTFVVFATVYIYRNLLESGK
jgi:hypothetical protein